MTKRFDFVWQIPVPPVLLTGNTFDRWTEEKEKTYLEQDCLFKVDEYGFFLYYKSPSKDGDCIELCQVSDIRAGGVPLDPKFNDKLVKKHGNNLDEKSLTICSGADYINISYQHIICQNAATAKLWLDGLRKITHNVKANNVCPMTCLKKLWIRLGFQVDVGGKVPVKVLVKTFSSGKTEKAVYECLEKLKLPHSKGDSMNKEDFTFDKFLTLYHTICPRNDIEDLFKSTMKTDKSQSQITGDHNDEI